MKKTTNIILFLLITLAASAQKIKVMTQRDTVTYNDLDAYYLAHNVRDGYWVVHFEGGAIQEEGRYDNDLMQEKWVRYYPNGKKCEEITYVANRAYGAVKFYYENGNLREEGTWVDKHWVGEYRYFYETGTPEYVWIFDELGSRTGTQLYFHENGYMMIEGTWNNGLEAGVIKEYYDDGTIKSQKNYTTGVIDTTSIKVFKRKVEPNKVVERTDSIGIFTGNGYYRTKNKFKKLDFDGIWKDGKYFDGQKYMYDEKGTLIKIQIFRNAQKIGEKLPE